MKEETDRGIMKQKYMYLVITVLESNEDGRAENDSQVYCLGVLYTSKDFNIKI